MDITSLLEIRQIIRVFYIRYERYIRYALRFLLAIITIGMINARMGYYEALSGFFVTFVLSLLCAVLPMGFTAFICAVLVLAHLYRYSLESCAIALVLFLCIYLMYYRFSPHDAFVMLLTPVLFAMHIPQIMPFVVGLIMPPVSVLSMTFGVVIWFFLHTTVEPAAESSASGLQAAEESLGRIQGIVGTMVADKTMIVYVVAFAAAALLIWLIRRLSINHAFLIAISAGAFVNLLILFVGDLALDAEVGIIGTLFGTLLGVVTGFVILFFVYNLDYSRVEQVQFEDEEYYYYVKAVPKIVLQERRHRQKSINRSRSTEGGHDSGEMTKEREHATRSAHHADKK